MRILHVLATGQRRGAELFAADLMQALGSSGVGQRVAVLRDPGTIQARYEPPTEILGLGRARVPGLKIEIPSLRGLRALIRRWEPDVLHAHGGEALKYLVFARGRAGPPIVYRRIAEAPLRIRRGPRRAVYSNLMRRPDRIVAVAEAIRRETIEVFRVPAERVVTIPRGVDARRLEPTRTRDEIRRELGIASDARVVLSLGALVWEKDPLAHLEVLKRLGPDVTHVFAGDGPLRSDLEMAIAREVLRDRALVLGSRSDIGDLLVASDVMLLASRSEGMPGCLIEAGMAGVPVVAYSVAGVPEVVEQGRTGVLVPPGDLDGLARETHRLLGDAEERRRMAGAARMRCRMFDIQEIAPRYLDIYRRTAKAA
jgi:glycosyltransferase involved in cell wall biosynthesis